MKAIVLHKYGHPSELHYEDVPDPTPGPGEILVRVSATSVNPIDYKTRSGAIKDRMPVEFPAILGRDLAGVIRTLGPGVDPQATGFEPGDDVFALTNHTYAQLCVVKATDLAKIPAGMDVPEAGALPLVLLTGNQLIVKGTEIKAGQTVLVAGAVGGVGRSAVRTAKMAGAHVIAGVRKHQLKEAATLGADSVLALDDEQAMQTLGLMDAIADAVGGHTAELLLPKVRQGGIFASVVAVPANAALNPTIRTVRIACQPDVPGLLQMAEEVKAGRLVIPIDRMLPLDEAAAAHTAAEKGGIGKILLLA